MAQEPEGETAETGGSACRARVTGKQNERLQGKREPVLSLAVDQVSAKEETKISRLRPLKVTQFIVVTDVLRS